jgi:magnesium-transporting ATPase (P-type)
MRILDDLVQELADMCRSVVVCRTSPLQKVQSLLHFFFILSLCAQALIVDMVTATHKRAITLAVGDGANDVAMIRCVNLEAR